jgi:predicted nucleic acid-binding protein
VRIVDALRARPAAAAYLGRSAGRMALSAITVAELWSGVRNADEAGAMEDFLSVFEIVPITHSIARKAGEYRNRFGSSHGIGLADCLIAATADATGAVLVTYNRRHFPMCERLHVPERD